MGMSIYTSLRPGGKHIGKRWAAGVWCWDCRQKAEYDGMGLFWFCPNCGQRTSDKTLSFNPAMRELGFDNSKPREHTGVDGASGFLWCVGENGLGDSVQEIRKALGKRKALMTENGRKMPVAEFLDMFKDIITEDVSEGDFC